ncbi:unnamed protein product [Ambrosiozyma monospora]|uniref:Unnamed protein product n=1 Tax=Ambrosiozyma monospora TaxID=43982 RepID=A0A9W6YVM3_AMBMO|nr:unnamed protein product [Ambrosiozyma monospora]
MISISSQVIFQLLARNKSITRWKKFWSKFSNFVNKNPGSYSTLHSFQTGHLYYQLNSHSNETCCYCNQSDFKQTNDHILDECIITYNIWRIIQQGTTFRLNTRYAPRQISQETIMGVMMPAQYYIKFKIYLDILLQINSHHFASSPKFHINIPENVTPEQLKKVVQKVVHFYQYPILLN